MTLNFDINAECNLKCKFCYQELDNFILSVNEIFNIMNQNPQFNHIEIGGGEPFLDKRLLEIIKNIRKKNKQVYVSTNTSLIPDGFLDLDDKVREGVEVQCSLPASNSELYKKITEYDKFDDVIRNIKLIKEKYSALISSAIYADNFGDVPGLVNLAENIDLPLRINLVYPIGKGKNVELLDKTQVEELRDYLLKEKIKNHKIDSPLIHINNCDALEQFYGLEKKGECPVDNSSKLYVSPKGEKFTCEFFRKIAILGGEKK